MMTVTKNPMGEHSNLPPAYQKKEEEFFLREEGAVIVIKGCVREE
jgi:hypothetical protein